MTRETVACVPSLFDADKNNDGQITSYEYVTFANNLAGEELFVGFPVSLLVSFSKLSCLCHYLGEPKTCCNNVQPHITVDGWVENNVPPNVELCYLNDVCSITQAVVDQARPTKPTPTPTKPTTKPTAIATTTTPPPTKVKSNSPSLNPTKATITTPTSTPPPTVQPNSPSLNPTLPATTKVKSPSPTPTSKIAITHHPSSSPSEAPTMTTKSTPNPTITPTSSTTSHSPSTSPTTSTESIEVFNGIFPIFLQYSIQNDAGLSGDDIFFGTDGNNNVKGELTEATSKMAQEVIKKLFDCDNLFDNDCRRRRLLLGGRDIDMRKKDTRRELKVTYDPTILPHIDQIFTVDCPKINNNKENADSITTTTTMCANVISTVFIHLEDEQSPTDIGSLFKSTFEEQIQNGVMQQFLPEDSLIFIYSTSSSSSPTPTPTPGPSSKSTNSIDSTMEGKSGGVSVDGVSNVISSSSSSEKKGYDNEEEDHGSKNTDKTIMIVGIVMGSVFIVVGLISIVVLSKKSKNKSETNNDENEMSLKPSEGWS